MKALLVAGLLLLSIAAIFSIISAAIPYWVDYNVEGASIHSGLWQSCETTDTTTACVTIDNIMMDAPGWFKGVRAMAILGVICLCLSVVFACLFSRYSNNRVTAVVAIILAILGGICCMIAIIVFGVKEKEMKSHFGAAFCLGIVAAILAFVAGIIIALAQRLTSGYASF